MIDMFIDPGKHKCAYAQFASALLIDVQYVTPFPITGRTYAELPQQRSRRSRVKVSDLIMLAFIAGQAAGVDGVPTTVAKWKGSRSKAAMHKRARTVLTPTELAVIDSYKIAPSLLHNVMDAVCMGLVYYKRMR